MFCKNCGAQIADQAVICVNCGVATGNNNANPVFSENVSEKNWIVTLLLCFFVGYLGIHRFYVGKIGTGVLMLITLGCFGIWTLVDFIMIIIGNFKDSNGRVISM